MTKNPNAVESVECEHEGGREEPDSHPRAVVLGLSGRLLERVLGLTDQRLKPRSIGRSARSATAPFTAAAETAPLAVTDPAHQRTRVQDSDHTRLRRGASAKAVSFIAQEESR